MRKTRTFSIVIAGCLIAGVLLGVIIVSLHLESVGAKDSAVRLSVKDYFNLRDEFKFDFWYGMRLLFYNYLEPITLLVLALSLIFNKKKFIITVLLIFFSVSLLGSIRSWLVSYDNDAENGYRTFELLRMALSIVKLLIMFVAKILLVFWLCKIEDASVKKSMCGKETGCIVNKKTTYMEDADKLIALKKLYDSGVISEQEFDDRKTEILAGKII